MQASGTADAWRWEDRGDGVWTLWLDRPGHSQNSLGPEALDELDERLGEIEARSGVRVVLVRSGKPRGFCAGADLRAILGCTSPEQVRAFLERGLTVFDRLSRLPMPSVAMIHGVCLGGG